MHKLSELLASEIYSMDLFVELASRVAARYGQDDPTVADIGYAFGYNTEVRAPYYQAIVRALPSDLACPILECGCGGGGVLKTILQSGYTNLYGIDHSLVGLALARKQTTGVKLFWGDLQNVELLHQKFNVIILAQVLEHINDDIQMLGCLARVLRKDGMFICSVPNKEKLPLCYEHVRQYTVDTIRQRYGSHYRVQIAWNDERNIVFQLTLERGD